MLTEASVFSGDTRSNGDSRSKKRRKYVRGNNILQIIEKQKKSEIEGKFNAGLEYSLELLDYASDIKNNTDQNKK